jgi:hypothetical protein
MDKPALVGWAAREGVQAGWDAAQRGDDGPPAWRDAIYGKRDAAAEAGTRVHDLFEAYLTHGTPPGELVEGESPEVASGLTNAVRWREGLAHEISVWSHEEPLVGDIDGLPFGGTPDALMTHPLTGDIELADWKTGGYYPDQHLAQLGAYAWLLREVEHIEVMAAHLVTFSRDTGAFAHHYIDDAALDLGLGLFHHLRHAYELRAQLKRYK